ncbi:MAG TPA: hypothetical protein VN616_09150 [Puia sp.]|nr:hypothetical protein [Puia sp.]
MRNLPLYLATAMLTLFCACKKSNSSHHSSNSNTNSWLSPGHQLVFPKGVQLPVRSGRRASAGDHHQL